MNLFGEEEKGAIFSKDRRYRYCLWRKWNPDKPMLIFIGLNPSTANEHTNDPTIRKVIKIANNNGYGAVMMLNLFAIISSDPDILLSEPDPVGENDRYLISYSNAGYDVVFAWGAFDQALHRAAFVSKLFKTPLCLQINSDGSPGHPLFISQYTKPFPYHE